MCLNTHVHTHVHTHVYTHVHTHLLVVVVGLDVFPYHLQGCSMLLADVCYVVRVQFLRELQGL